MGGPSRGAGRLEILHNGQWGTVCTDRFDKVEADLVCAQLGLGLHLTFGASRSKYGVGDGPIWMDELLCTGREARLADCRFHGFGQFWGATDCNHDKDVSVECTLETAMRQTLFSWRRTSPRKKLRGFTF